MQEQAITMKQIEIKRKMFLVPEFNLYGCEKYMLPKLNNAQVHHTFFETKDIEEVYKKMDVDPSTLNHNLQIKTQEQLKKKEEQQMMIGDEKSLTLDEISMVKQQESIVDTLNNGRPRPPLKPQGYTHFIHISFIYALREIYQNNIVPKVQEEDRDILMPLSSMHTTVMVFRVQNLKDIPKWTAVLKAAKRCRVSIRGASIFSKKGNYGNTLYLNIKGLEDLIDSIVHKAIQLQLIREQDLSHIKFDKTSQTYKAQPHISLLRTKGDDLYDFTEYLKLFKNINLAKINVNEIRLSMIGTHDGEDYYNQQILNL